LLPPEQAVREYSPAEQLALDRLKANALVGSAATVGSRLRQLARQLAVDELVVITWTHDPQAQRHSYALLAREFSLSTQGQTA
jgi:alkanesulfonate monooxygenase SsuD/methylene tetrahydromethanopterin reductase-like flavin-dependent oxidoreductase (luciferase family)